MEYIIEILGKLKSEPSEKFESENIEFKNYASEQALHNAKDLTEEISAIANAKGGFIVVGIIDSSDIKNKKWSDQLHGFTIVDLDTTKERLLGKLEPKIDLKLVELEFESKDYLIIQIPNVTHTLVSTTSGKTCIRIGKSSMPARPEQIKELVKALQSFDWSEEDLSENIDSALDLSSISEAKSDFSNRRGIPIEDLSNDRFLESIGATKNGVLNKGGLLLLGKASEIKRILGNYEYRFSWKTPSGELKINDVWNDNIWNTINRARAHFEKCNSKITLPYEGNNYDLFTLDYQAFHEAYLNSIVHRDYSEEGMTSVNFVGDKLLITNPGTFYGGVSSSNITFHEPRHRNKCLARILMNFQLVDRAGMGVLRMGLNSLKYGREFPRFEEKLKNIEVSMAAEYFKSGVFILTQKYLKSCGLVELYIMNSLHKTGFVSVSGIEKKLASLVENPWKEIIRCFENEEFKKYFSLKANNDGVYICPNEIINSLFDITKPFKDSVNSDKHVKLYIYLKEHKMGSNGDLMNLLGFASPASTYQFLIKLKYVGNKGKSQSSKWFLK
jgi:predicted HTH transcriptional regulator